MLLGEHCCWSLMGPKGLTSLAQRTRIQIRHVVTESFVTKDKRAMALRKQNVIAFCPKDKMEFNLFSSPVKDPKIKSFPLITVTELRQAVTHVLSRTYMYASFGGESLQRAGGTAEQLHVPNSFRSIRITRCWLVRNHPGYLPLMLGTFVHENAVVPTSCPWVT